MRLKGMLTARGETLNRRFLFLRKGFCVLFPRVVQIVPRRSNFGYKFFFWTLKRGPLTIPEKTIYGFGFFVPKFVRILHNLTHKKSHPSKFGMTPKNLLPCRFPKSVYVKFPIGTWGTDTTLAFMAFLNVPVIEQPPLYYVGSPDDHTAYNCALFLSINRKQTPSWC